MQKKQAVLGGVHTRTAGCDDRETGATGSPLKSSSEPNALDPEGEPAGVEAELQGSWELQKAFGLCLCALFVYLVGRGHAPQHLATCVFHYNFDLFDSCGPWGAHCPDLTCSLSCAPHAPLQVNTHIHTPHTHTTFVQVADLTRNSLKTAKPQLHVSRPTYKSAGRLERTFVLEKSHI